MSAHGGPRQVIVRGVVTVGLGKAAHFTTLPWVQREFAAKLGLQPWPGTFNVRVDAGSLELWAALAASCGIEIEPPDTTTCVARCYPVQINDRIGGAIVLPHVPAYPPDQIEVVAAQCIRTALAVGDGDPVFLRVLEHPQPRAG